MQHTKAFNTRKGYAHSWSIFDRWCAAAGQPALPTTSEIVALFVTWALGERRYRVGTVAHVLSAVRDRHETTGHPQPIDRKVRDLVKAARRALQEEPGGKAALLPEQLVRCCRTFDSADPVHVRDRALLLVGFSTGWRRSELSNLNLKDVSFVRSGMRLRQGRSKTDQEGKGRVTGIPFDDCPEMCPVLALRAWLKVRGVRSGPLFYRFDGGRKMTEQRLSGRSICLALQRVLARIGLDARSYGAHSMRSGMITAAAEAGSSDIAIMQRTGHRSMANVLRYVRPSEVFRVDPLAGVFRRAADSLSGVL